MRVEKGFKELLKFFNRHKVKYVIVGAFAVAFHGFPRYTKDMDILVEPDAKNAKRILCALKEFGFGSLQLSRADFAKEGTVVQLGYEPIRIDLITRISGLKFDKLWRAKVKGDYGGIKVNIIGLNELIKAKKITGRKDDIKDLQKISKIKNKTR